MMETQAAHWYCLSHNGIATLCADEQDAINTADQRNILWTNNGPYRAAQLVDISAVAAERERCAKLVETEIDPECREIEDAALRKVAARIRMI